MADRVQSASSHIRWFPLFHFVAAPATLVYAIRSCYLFVSAPSSDTGFGALFAIGVLCAVFSSRLMVVTVQDRVIRLEETLRAQRILPASMQESIGKITPKQFVALRFASDGELAELTQRVLAGELTEAKDIKRAIRLWRADWLRA